VHYLSPSQFRTNVESTDAAFADRAKRVDEMTESPWKRAEGILSIIKAHGQVREYDLACLSAVFLAQYEVGKFILRNEEGKEKDLFHTNAMQALAGLLDYHYRHHKWSEDDD
jgi:hypothetical protein